MTAIGVIILLTQILPSLGYYPKEDEVFVNQFETQAKEVVLKNILAEEIGEDVLTLDDFEATTARAAELTEEAILKESKTLAGKKAAGTIGAIRVLPRALKNINWLELLLAMGTIIIIYGFKRITKVIPSTLVALLVMSGIAYGFGLNYRPIEEIPGGIPVPKLEIFTNFKLGTVSPYISVSYTHLTLPTICSV